jgi:hypothetical protein
MKPGFNEFMNETKVVNKWFVLKIAMIGAFAGAVLAVVYMMAFIV